VKAKFASVLNYFGEEPSLPSHIFFTTLNKFLAEFCATRVVVERLVREDEKKARDAGARMRRASMAVMAEGESPQTPQSFLSTGSPSPNIKTVGSADGLDSVLAQQVYTVLLYYSV